MNIFGHLENLKNQRKIKQFICKGTTSSNIGRDKMCAVTGTECSADLKQ